MTPDREWEPCPLCNGAGKVGHRYDEYDVDYCNGCDGQGGRWFGKSGFAVRIGAEKPAKKK